MFDLPEHHSHTGLMLDYDGTLTPIVPNPKNARITADKLTILKRLAQSPQVSLAIVSGRSIEQLEAFLGDLTCSSIILCGLHGGEIVQYPGRQVLKTPLPHIQEEIAHFKAELESLLAAQNILDKILLEDKGSSLAMHYRQADEQTKTMAIECFCTAFRDLDEEMTDFRPQGGKEVLEIVPKDFSKGACVEFLMKHWQAKNPEHEKYPIYVGDDLTDETAFLVANRMGGISIRIGEPNVETRAQSVIRSINLLYYALTQLLLRPASRLVQS